MLHCVLCGHHAPPRLRQRSCRLQLCKTLHAGVPTTVSRHVMYLNNPIERVTTCQKRTYYVLVYSFERLASTVLGSNPNIPCLLLLVPCHALIAEESSRLDAWSRKRKRWRPGLWFPGSGARGQMPGVTETNPLRRGLHGMAWHGAPLLHVTRRDASSESESHTTGTWATASDRARPAELTCTSGRTDGALPAPC